MCFCWSRTRWVDLHVDDFFGSLSWICTLSDAHPLIHCPRHCTALVPDGSTRMGSKTLRPSAAMSLGRVQECEGGSVQKGYGATKEVEQGEGGRDKLQSQANTTYACRQLRRTNKRNKQKRTEQNKTTKLDKQRKANFQKESSICEKRIGGSNSQKRRCLLCLTGAARVHEFLQRKSESRGK